MITIYKSAGDKLGKAICGILDIDYTLVIAIDIHIRPYEPVIVEIGRIISPALSDSVETELKKYKLLPIDT